MTEIDTGALRRYSREEPLATHDVLKLCGALDEARAELASVVSFQNQQAERLDAVLTERDLAVAELKSWLHVLGQSTDKIDELVSQVGDLQHNHDVMELRALQAEAERDAHCEALTNALRSNKAAEARIAAALAAVGRARFGDPLAEDVRRALGGTE